MLQKTKHFLQLVRFSHTIFAMPFALLSAMMAWALGAKDNPPHIFRFQEWIGIVLCMICARSTAMAFNRLADRYIDAKNPRTVTRHIPAGLLSVKTVWAFTILSAAGFIGATFLFLPNWLPPALSVPVLLFLCGYSYAKRFTSLAHYWLGAALMLAPICAWIAIRGEVLLTNPRDILPAIVLGVAVFFWVGGFDIIYSCQDADFDRDTGLKSIPARFGIAGALRLAALSHFIMLGVLATLPFLYPAFGMIFWIGLAVIAALIIYEHSIVKPNDLTRVNDAFFTVNSIVGMGLFVVGAIDAWW